MRRKRGSWGRRHYIVNSGTWRQVNFRRQTDQGLGFYSTDREEVRFRVSGLVWTRVCVMAGHSLSLGFLGKWTEGGQRGEWIGYRTERALLCPKDFLFYTVLVHPRVSAVHKHQLSPEL